MKENEDVLEGMLVLAQRKEADINVKHASHTYRIYQCQDTTCREILISSKRSDNAAYCGVCKSKNGSIKRALKRRNECYDEQIAANSKTPFYVLTDEQKQARHANNHQVKKQKTKQILRLKK